MLKRPSVVVTGGAMVSESPMVDVRSAGADRDLDSLVTIGANTPNNRHRRQHAARSEYQGQQ